MTDTYNEQIKNYKVEDRVNEMLKTMTVDEAIKHCEKEQNDIWENSGNFFGDCAGHAMTCLNLQLNFLKQL